MRKSFEFPKLDQIRSSEGIKDAIMSINEPSKIAFACFVSAHEKGESIEGGRQVNIIKGLNNGEYIDNTKKSIAPTQVEYPIISVTNFDYNCE